MKNKARVLKNRKKLKANPLSKPVVLVWISLIALCIFVWLSFQITHFLSGAAVNSWVDNNRDLMKNSPWFITHDYRDCASQSGGYWTTHLGDCLFREPASGPLATDVVKDPPGLYYKHFLPTDWLHNSPELLLSLDFSNLSIASLEAQLVRVIQENPTKYGSLSLSSLDLGIEGGNIGTIIRSASLYVHPRFERPIVTAIGQLQRARNLYKPFIEGATGSTISDADLTALYEAALNRCGGSAVNNDQSGLGVSRNVGEYVVVVQNWNSGSLEFGANDCNLHVVNPNIFPTPSSVTPTFVCGGSNICVPTSTPGVTTFPSVTPQPSPTATPIVTSIPTPTVAASVTPSSAPGIITPTSTPTNPPPKPGFFQQILALILLFLNFLLQIFGLGK